MERVQIIQHKGAKIHFGDYSGLSPGKDMQAVLNKVKALTQAQPENSVLELTDLTDVRFDTDMLSKIREVTTSNAPYVRASAVIGVGGLLHIALDAITRVSRRNVRVFLSKDEALDWLAEQ